MRNGAWRSFVPHRMGSAGRECRLDLFCLRHFIHPRGTCSASLCRANLFEHKSQTYRSDPSVIVTAHILILIEAIASGDETGPAAPSSEAFPGRPSRPVGVNPRIRRSKPRPSPSPPVLPQADSTRTHFQAPTALPLYNGGRDNQSCVRVFLSISIMTTLVSWPCNFGLLRWRQVCVIPAAPPEPNFRAPIHCQPSIGTLGSWSTSVVITLLHCSPVAGRSSLARQRQSPVFLARGHTRPDNRAQSREPSRSPRRRLGDLHQTHRSWSPSPEGLPPACIIQWSTSNQHRRLVKQSVDRVF